MKYSRYNAGQLLLSSSGVFRLRSRNDPSSFRLVSTLDPFLPNLPFFFPASSLFSFFFFLSTLFLFLFFFFFFHPCRLVVTFAVCPRSDRSKLALFFDFCLYRYRDYRRALFYLRLRKKKKGKKNKRKMEVNDWIEETINERSLAR